MSEPTTTPYCKVIDCFPYNGELIASFRVKYLYPVVDEFVIVESWETHSGQRKPFLYFTQPEAKEAFAPFLGKITYIVVDAFPEPPVEWLNTVPPRYSWMKPEAVSSWWREMYQREVAERYIRSKYTETPKFIVHVSDADEIPHKDFIMFAKTDNNYEMCSDAPVYLDMAFFYYNFAWQKGFNWHYAFVMNAQCIREKNITFNEARVGLSRERIAPKAGWHCSYFFSKEDLRRKLQSFAHRECDKEEYKTDEYLQECITLGLDIAGRRKGEHCHPTPSTQELPEGWQEVQTRLLNQQLAQ